MSYVNDFKKELSEANKFDEYFNLRFGQKSNITTIEYVESLKKQKLMDLGFLYKYRGSNEIKRFISMKKEQELYLSEPSSFNDPYDTRVPNVTKQLVNLRKDVVRELPILLYQKGYLAEDKLPECQRKLNDTLKIRDWDEWYKALFEIEQSYHITSSTFLEESLRNLEAKGKIEHEKYVKHVQSKFGISCFSETYESLLMWTHYADNHTGICFGYSVEKFFTPIGCVKTNGDKPENDSDNAPLVDALYPVNYQNDLSYSFEQYRKFFDDELTKEEKENLPFILALTKAKEWIYEREWRLVMSVPNGCRVLPLNPSCIYLGSKINEQDKRHVCTIAGQNKIPVKQMELNEGTFNLVAKDVDLSKFYEEKL